MIEKSRAEHQHKDNASPMSNGKNKKLKWWRKWKIIQMYIKKTRRMRRLWMKFTFFSLIFILFLNIFSRKASQRYLFPQLRHIPSLPSHFDKWIYERALFVHNLPLSHFLVKVLVLVYTCYPTSTVTHPLRIRFNFNPDEEKFTTLSSIFLRYNMRNGKL